MSLEPLYQQRLARCVTAMRNETPDRVPIRPFVAEATAACAGMTCQEVYPGAPTPTATPPCDLPASVADRSALAGLGGLRESRVAPGVCLPWAEKLPELPPIPATAISPAACGSGWTSSATTTSGSCC